MDRITAKLKIEGTQYKIKLVHRGRSAYPYRIDLEKKVIFHIYTRVDLEIAKERTIGEEVKKLINQNMEENHNQIEEKFYGALEEVVAENDDVEMERPEDN